jgi:hypothetical protein
MLDSFRRVFLVLNISSGIAVATLLLFTQQSYINYTTTVFMYIAAMFFINRALLMLYLNTSFTTPKIPRILIRFQRVKVYVYQLLLFTVTSTVLESILRLMLRSSIYSALASLPASILILYTLNRLSSELRFLRYYSIAIVILAFVLYLAKFLDESVYSTVDSQLRFLEVLLSG